MDDRGAELRLDVVADDRHTRLLEALRPAFVASDEHRNAVHERYARLERAFGVELRRLLRSHRKVVDLNVGADAVISATVYGTAGGCEVRNVGGSFFDFAADYLNGRERETLASPPDEWGGRAAVEWLNKLAAGERFAGTTTGLAETARTLDRLYGRS